MLKFFLKTLGWLVLLLAGALSITAALVFVLSTLNQMFGPPGVIMVMIFGVLCIGALVHTYDNRNEWEK